MAYIPSFSYVFLALLIPFPGLPQEVVCSGVFFVALEYGPGACKHPGEQHYALELGDCWMLVLYICVCTYIYIIYIE